MSTPEIRQDVPKTIEKLEKRVAKLKQLQAEFFNEINEVELEIDYLKKSLTHNNANANVNLLRDIPELVWSNILSLYQVEENDLWSLCLASADIEKRFNRDNPGARESLVAKKVMAVLTRNHYLTRHDLLKCFNLGSPRLEDAAAEGWRYLKNTVPGTMVEFNDSRAIVRFMGNVRRRRNIWAAFIGKSFIFDSYNLRSLNERDNYVRAVREFLGKYGKFIFSIEIKHISWTDEGERIGFMKRLLRTIPNIQHFMQRHNYETPILSTSFDITNKQNVTSFFKVDNGIGDHYFYKIVGPQCHTWRINFWEFAQFQFVCPQTEIYCKNVKVLELRAQHCFTLAQYETFQRTDFSCFVSLKKLILHGEDHMTTLTLVEKFPQVREVSLHLGIFPQSEEQYQPPSAPLGFVKKLTLVLNYIEPPPLDQIGNALPSLRRLCLTGERTSLELQNYLKDWKNRGTFQNDIIDMYDLYAEGESLSGSNIWQHMENLHTLVVESVAKQLQWEPYPGKEMRRGGYTKRNEIYSRKEGNVTRTQEIVLDDEWRLLG